jgi:hypothetical protein
VWASLLAVKVGVGRRWRASVFRATALKKKRRVKVTEEPVGNAIKVAGGECSS